MVMGLEMQHNTNIANHIASTMSIPCKRQHVGKQIPDPQLLDGKLYYYTTCHICDTKLVQCAHCDICFDPQSKTVTNYRYGIDGYYVSRHKALNRSCLSQYQPPKRHKSTHDNDEWMDIEIQTGNDSFFHTDENNIIHTSDSNSVEVCFSTACDNDLFSISNKTPHCGDSKMNEKDDKTPHCGDSKMNEKDDKDLFSFIRTFFSGCCWTEHSDDTKFNYSSDGSDLHVRSDHSLMSKSSDESCSNSGLSEATSNEDDVSYDSGASIESWGQTNVDSNQHEENGTTHVQTPLEEIENTQYGYEDFSFFRQENDGIINNNQLYFWHIYRAGQSQPLPEEPRQTATAGYRSLVYRATKRSKTDSSGLATFMEAELLFRMNVALLNVTVKSKHDVMKLVSCLCKSGTDSPYDTVPQDYTSARRVILDGSFSIMNNFPSPKVFAIGNHACMSLKETVQHMAGNGVSFEYTYDSYASTRCRDGLHGTEGARDLVIEARKAMEASKFEHIKETSIGWVYFWSDSFLRCYSKQKDNSVWLFAVTVCPPHSDISTGSYTRILAMGKSGNDHTDVINYFHNEIKDMMKGFRIFCRKTNTLRWISLGLLYTSADRPERQAILNVLKEGTYGKVSLYSAPIVHSKLPPCEKCYLHLIEKIALGYSERESPRICTKCFAWNIDPNDESQAVFPVPENYPGETILRNDDGVLLKPPKGREPGRKHIGPIRLTSKWMVVACVYAYEARGRKRWNSNEFHAFLRTCNVCESRRTIIEDTALKDYADSKRSPLEDWLPELWLNDVDTFSIRRWPDVPMHAIGHGMGADIIEFFEQILTSQKKGNDFTKFANKIIEDISDFKLSWCKVLRYPKKGWVAENVMAYMRLLSYIYGMYLVNRPMGDETKDLVEAMKRMLITFQPMMSMLMTRTDPDNNEEYAKLVRGHVQLFMTAAHYCDLECHSNLKNITKTKKSKVKVTDLITYRDALNILDEMPGSFCDSSDPKKCLNEIKKEHLIQKLKAEGIRYKKSAPKAELQLSLFSSILGVPLKFPDSSVETAVAAAPVSNNNQSDTNKFVWDKGGWLSYVTNCEEQIINLSLLHKIW